ncbi:MAG: hypothetical protein ACLRFG_02230 [Clostridia bacterium]
MFWNAFVNVLAIIAIIIVAAFVMVFVGDLLISIIDGKKGIFFKGNKKQKVEEIEHTEDVSYAQRQELERLQSLYRNQKGGAVQEPQPVKTEMPDDYLDRANAVNYDLAKKEEEMLAQKSASSKLLVPKSEPVAEEVEVSSDKVFAEVSTVADEILSHYETEKTNAEKIDDYAKELDNYKIDSVIPMEEDEDEIVEEEIEEVEEIVAEPVEVVKEVVKEVVVDNPEIVEQNKQLQTQLAELQKALKDAEERNQQLQNVQLEEPENFSPLYTTVEDCEARIELLENRLRVARKELKVNDKEFKPLFKVRKNLNKYKERLRRKELSVTRQKVVLYGVNNYVDIDKERAEKLANDIELLDGLRLSVQDCESVVEQSKDRYPILEQTNRLLKTQISDLEHDLEVTRGILEALKADAMIDENENGIDDRDEDNDEE